MISKVIFSKLCEICFLLASSVNIISATTPDSERAAWLASLILTYFYAHGGLLLWRILGAKPASEALYDVPLAALVWYVVFRAAGFRKILKLGAVQSSWYLVNAMTSEVDAVLRDYPKGFIAAFLGGGLVGVGGTLFDNLEESMSGKRRLSALGRPPASFKRGFLMSFLYTLAVFYDLESFVRSKVSIGFVLKTWFCVHRAIEAYLGRDLSLFYYSGVFLKAIIGMDVRQHRRSFAPRSTFKFSTGAEFAYWNRNRQAELRKAR
ncbi:hypothetical protein NDN08_006573 [Rhodosorus marinus]|uniref:Uncharacterized protein n=1 Tax=Rhodosorus marinus TaxID=101924 RepID=A0AAV8UI07_9RHOD|nr:hypothetical protein NDN08_006573 [Rhodosorus marinus]